MSAGQSVRDREAEAAASADRGPAKTPEEKHAAAAAIYKRFITTDTEELINLSAKVAKGLKTYFDAASGDMPPAEPGKPPGPTKGIFDGVLKCIDQNLRGTLQTFCVTPAYKEVLEDFAIYTPRSKRPGKAIQGASAKFC